MRNATLLFLIKKSEGKISEVCLAMKKRGFGVGRWNGVGGKLTEGETIEEATIREAQEEIGILAKNINKIAELSFKFPHKPDWDQVVHTYFTEEWEGDPQESEEMNPKWFNIKDIPFSEMWSDDILWLPQVIEGNLLKGEFVFNEGDIIKDHKTEIVKLF